MDESTSTESCYLCGKSKCYSSRMTTFANWNEKDQQFIIRHLDHTPAPNTQLCKGHILEARRHTNDPDYIPKWKKSLGKLNIIESMYPTCKINSTDTKVSRVTFAPDEQLREAIGLYDNDEPIYLCKEHYNEIYIQLTVLHVMQIQKKGLHSPIIVLILLIYLLTLAWN